MATSSARVYNRNGAVGVPEPPKPPNLSASGASYGYDATPTISGFCGSTWGLPPYSGYSSPSFGYGPRFSPGFSSYGVGLHTPGMDPDIERFMRETQNWANKTFQPLATVMNSVSSIGTLLQTTYISFQSCIQAIVYVSHSFSSLGTQFNGLLALFSITRVWRKLNNFLQYVLGLIGARPKLDSVWDVSEAGTLAPKLPAPTESCPSPWGIPLVLAVAYGAHIVLRRIMQMARDVSIPQWARDDGHHLVGVVTEDFAGFPNEGCLPLKSGYRVRIAPSANQSQNLVRQGWLLAAVLDAEDTTGASVRIGLVPRSLVAQPAGSGLKSARRRAPNDSGDLSSD